MKLALASFPILAHAAAQLEAYARVRDDAESQRKFAEIRLRACQRIGQLSAELETHQGHRLNDVTKSKEQVLNDSGISKPTANRYEELAGGREQQAQECERQQTHISPARRLKIKPYTTRNFALATRLLVSRRSRARFRKRFHCLLECVVRTFGALASRSVVELFLDRTLGELKCFLSECSRLPV